MEEAYEEIYQTHAPHIKVGSVYKPALVVFSAIPGSGKSELTKRLMNRHGFTGIANKDIRKSLELTRHSEDVNIGNYTLWVLNKIAQRQPTAIVFDRNIDQWYDDAEKWAAPRGYQYIVVRIEVSRTKLEQRLHIREGENVSKVLSMLDFYHEAHTNMRQTIRPSIILSDDYDLDAAAQTIADMVIKGDGSSPI